MSSCETIDFHFHLVGERMGRPLCNGDSGIVFRSMRVLSHLRDAMDPEQLARYTAITAEIRDKTATSLNTEQRRLVSAPPPY